MSADRDPAPMPPPEAAARAHSERLQQRIREEIEAAGGAIPFKRYMELALYAPGLGYYAAAGGARLPEQGDFVTAPGVSPLFARCVARQLAEVLDELGGGDLFEPGPGSGRLAAGLLAELERLERLPRRYRLLERSAELRAQQRATLEARVPHLLDRCAWHDEWPRPFAGAVVANELLDAFPVEGFRRTDDRVEQRCVTLDGDRFVDDWRPAPARLAHAVAHLEQDLGHRLPAGYVSELQFDYSGWFAGLGDCLDRGAVLLIDYGYVRSEYYLPERDGGTLVCTRAHRAHGDPYDWPGLTDLSAFVDFTAVTEAATGAGLELEGFTPQAHFLFASGLEAVAAEAMATADEAERLRIAQQVKTLTLPGEMGERFNVIGFSRGLDRPLSGFDLNDLSHRL
ncbi:MAG: SAM-dependent methyltransferase [Halofilum sp. (in: g-proteobacteria)]|nr:SAM-dependent methyltransferase [Halofilum sp. (in: g-proteobacteria)]